MEMKTAVEWLIDQTRTPEWHSLKRGDMFEQDLKMEKQQIIEASSISYEDMFGVDGTKYGEKYYNQKFKKK